MNTFLNRDSFFFQFTRTPGGARKNHQHEKWPVRVISPINVYDRKLDIAETGERDFLSYELYLTLLDGH